MALSADTQRALAVGLASQVAANDIAASISALEIAEASAIANAETLFVTAPVGSPLTAEALRDDLVANVIPSIETALSILGTKINAILAVMRTRNEIAE